MLLYLDSSALVKRYLSEPGTQETRIAFAEAEVVATAVVSRVEVAAAFAKTVRRGAAGREEVRSLLDMFRSDWQDFFQLHLSMEVVVRAEQLAWDEDLRGYDAVQLASALAWADGIDERVTFATFDRRLWETASVHPPLSPFPNDLPALLDEWTQGP